MVRNFILLLRNKLLISWNSIKFITREKTIKLLVSIILGVIFVVGDYFFFHKILLNIKNQPIGGLEVVLMVRLMTMVFLVFFSMLVFSNIITSISTAYLSDDIDLLVSSPILMKVICFEKLLETLLNSSWLVVLAGIPIFVAFGKVNNATIWFYGWIVMVFVPFLVLPATIGMSLTMILMRFFPAKRTHQILTILGVIFISVLTILFRLLKPEQLIRPVESEIIAQFLLNMRIPSKSYLPSTWATEALVCAVENRVGYMAWNWVYLMISSVVGILLAIFLGSKIYLTGWVTSRESKLVKTRIHGGVEEESRFFHWWFSDIHKTTRYLVMKDIKIFFRDASQWSQLFLLGALVVIYLFNIRMLPLKTFNLQNIIVFINIILSNLVMAGIAVRFLFPAISLEGKCFWIIHSSPMKYHRLLWEKFFVFIIPLVILGESITIISNVLLDADNYMMILSLVTNLGVIAGLAGLGVGLGAIMPKFDANNPAQIAVGLGGIMYMVLSLIFIGLIVLCLIRPVFSHYYYQLTSTDTAEPDMSLYYMAAVLLCIMAIFIPMHFGKKSLAKLEL